MYNIIYSRYIYVHRRQSYFSIERSFVKTKKQTKKPLDVNPTKVNKINVGCRHIVLLISNRNLHTNTTRFTRTRHHAW